MTVHQELREARIADDRCPECGYKLAADYLCGSCGHDAMPDLRANVAELAGELAAKESRIGGAVQSVDVIGVVIEPYEPSDAWSVPAWIVAAIVLFDVLGLWKFGEVVMAFLGAIGS